MSLLHHIGLLSIGQSESLIQAQMHCGIGGNSLGRDYGKVRIDIIVVYKDNLVNCVLYDVCVVSLKKFS